jgi:hypothetical protein
MTALSGHWIERAKLKITVHAYGSNRCQELTAVRGHRWSLAPLGSPGRRLRAHGLVQVRFFFGVQVWKEPPWLRVNGSPWMDTVLVQTICAARGMLSASAVSEAVGSGGTALYGTAGATPHVARTRIACQCADHVRAALP